MGEWQPIAAGDTFTIRYPFVREAYQAVDEDGYQEVMSWRPGVTVEPDGYDVCYGADGEGWQRLTVVDVVKPGKFPTRVFYTRSWGDPTGHEFGKRRLLICTLEKFRRLAAGYKWHYELNSADAPVALLPALPVER